MHALPILCEFKVINVIMNMHNKTELSWFLACLVFHSHTCDLCIQSSSTFFQYIYCFIFQQLEKYCLSCLFTSVQKQQRISDHYVLETKEMVLQQGKHFISKAQHFTEVG